MKDFTSNKIYSVLSCVSLIIIWWAAALMIQKTYILPSPLIVGKTTWGLLTTLSTYTVILGTLMRVVVCIGLSFFFGGLLAVLAHFIQPIRYMLKPLLLIVRTLPTIVIIVYVILWMSKAWSPIFVTFLVTFPIVYTNVLEGLDRVPQDFIEMAKVYQLTLKKRLKALYIPSIFPYIKASLAAVTNLALKVVIASEVLSQTSHSIGRHFQVAKINIETDVVFAWALITIFLAVGLDNMVKRLSHMRKGKA